METPFPFCFVLEKHEPMMVYCVAFQNFCLSGLFDARSRLVDAACFALAFCHSFQSRNSRARYTGRFGTDCIGPSPPLNLQEAMQATHEKRKGDCSVGAIRRVVGVDSRGFCFLQANDDGQRYYFFFKRVEIIL